MEFKGFYPENTGLRKFLTDLEIEVLACLWSMGEYGGDAKIVKALINIGPGEKRSLASVKRTLENLECRGLVEYRSVAHSNPKLSYFSKYNENELAQHLVNETVGKLFNAMPEEAKAAASKHF